jgi:hypothetical protein
MTRHSNLVGGSTADRLIHCPGNFKLRQRLPDIPEVSSEYARHGSAMHAVMDQLMPFYAEGFPPLEGLLETAAEFVGDTFIDRELSQKDFDECIAPAIEDLYRLMEIYGGDFRVVGNELSVDFPGVPGAHGTTDLLLASPTHVLLVDWKFGTNEVKAVYTDDKGEYVNCQLQFYLAASINSKPKLFTKKRFAVAIIQPRILSGETLTHTSVSRKEVSYFVEDLAAAVTLAVGPNPPLHAGDHCKWCPAFAICPEHTGAVFDLDALGELKPAVPVPANTDDGEYGAFLAKAKQISDMFKDYAKTIDDQLHRYLESGGHVPGWKLKYKTKLRQWVDSDEVAPKLRTLGFAEDDIWVRKLQTFGHTDKVAKKLGVKIPDELRVTPESTETVPVPENDPAPAIDRETATAEFAAALLAISVEPR